ncbi:acetyltransferase (GNAT) family protein [Murinocardiopsis flavida]|uniref:Acetyltransferase (GNAT) family protein n=1 Tax=Murinocardiopsis flavida TaxID=645275 RepID=A0A2P8CUZ6_9ACTN|nr:GNAT family N-acetyltransferase [Murinocardiopsis flavida]PSK88785.1 acetyltransferase (GNAT) family protein [Murinocardiopsis flavida]
MALDVVPFADHHIDHAVALLTAAHAPTGAAVPAVDLADPGAARAQLDAFGAAGPAVAALSGGVPVGFMAATVPKLQGTPLGRVRMQHHAAAPDGIRATYRHLYRALAQELVDVGCFEHTVKVAAEHRDTVACLVELGFGFDQVKGFRPIAPLAGPARQVRLRRAHRDDLADLVRLTVELQRFHAQAPMLRPAEIDVLATGDDLRAAIADDRRLVLVAETHGRPAGVMVADHDSRYSTAASIGIAAVTADARSEGIGTALLAGVVEWAADQGFGSCGAEWTSANLVSDAFWRGHGFVPARYTLTRRVDPRVSLDYRHFVPR